MNTFLPFTSYALSAQHLDDRRLFAQLKECKQLWAAIHFESKGWVNHPAARMWRPYTEEFLSYWRAILLETIKRGKVNPEALASWRRYVDSIDIPLLRARPWWLDHPPIYVSHRSNLYRKDRVFYRAFECQEIGYFWPDPTEPRYMYMVSGEPKTKRILSLEEANEEIKTLFHVEGISWA